MAKIVKGSALIDDFGGVTFTPYESNPAENTPWTLLAQTQNGKLQCSRRKVNLVLTLERTADTAELICQLSRQSAQLTASLVKASVVKKYFRSAEGRSEDK